MDKNFSIVFMGTPEFAVTILDKLHKEGITIKGVVTAPDKKAGRGRKINQSAVKEYAVENGLNVLQPTNLKDEEFISELNELQADLFVVVAFRMLPQVVWSMPSKGTINLHASLLPNYRGAAPINWAIINGEKESGVSTFFIEKEIDTGEIIEQEKTSIGENESVGELYERLMNIGAETMLSTVHKIESGNITSVSQDQLLDSSHKPAPKIFKEDCKINFNSTVENVHNFCRGLAPYPGAWCTLYNKDKNESKTFKVFATLKTSISTNSSKEIKSDGEGILIPCSDYFIRVLEIQSQGKRKMNFKDFLAGNSVDNHTVIDA
ncbi:MAG: methionyl-tRNA formyltransferase [Crocinitomicaceae bacterium]|nr:methionyl-tRNA formyltransferase [Crocinitomicaceae bacterium]